MSLGRLEYNLLGILAANAQHVVTADRLVEGLWGAHPPASARNRVQALVSSTRRALGESGGLIVTQALGYLLRINHGHYDADMFEALARLGRRASEECRHAEAIRLLGEALSLWRGQAFEGITSSLVLPEAARLDELRSTVSSEWADARLTVGEHADLVADLSRLVVADPLRERLRGQLMVALYRSGRQAEALRVYAEGATALAEEHGLDVGQELQRLRQAILTDDPALWGTSTLDRPGEVLARTLPNPVPAQLPPGVRDFIGRCGELAQLDTILASRQPTAVAISALSGTAGVGKTALAIHWAHRVSDQFPDGQLYIDLRGFGPGGSAMSPVEALREFVEAFGIPPQRIPRSVGGLVSLYRSLLGGRRVLVVLDNARDAEQVRPLLPGAPGCLVVVTSRTELTSLVAAEGAHPLTLDLLTTSEARELLEHRIDQSRCPVAPHALDEVVARCARLPLALAIAAARAGAHPRLPVAALADQLRESKCSLDAFNGGDAATDIRAVFSWSYHTLSTDAAQLFRLLGVHPGPDIAAPAAASLTGRTPAEIRLLLEELGRAHLVTERTRGRYTLHRLLRAYAKELAHRSESNGELHSAVHRALDHYLHTAHAGAVLLNPHRSLIRPATPQPGVTPDTLNDHEHALAWFASEHAVLLAVIEQAVDWGFGTHSRQLSWTLTDLPSAASMVL